MLTYTCTIDTPLGPMTAAAEGKSLVGLWFVGQKHYPAEVTQWIQRPQHPVFQWLRLYLRCYFAGKVGDHDFPLAPHGSPLQLEVWEAISAISYGRSAPPGAIARNFLEGRNGEVVSVLEVERAIESTPISILIPSHRVLARSGMLADYPGGAEKKEYLLRLEGVLGQNLLFSQSISQGLRRHLFSSLSREL